MSVFAGRFAGRTAIVTGGASGLGLAVAERIEAEGGAVSLWDMSDALDAVCERLGAHGVRVDVSDEDAVDAAATASEAALGRVDILVGSAGITGPTVPVHDFGFEGWRRTLAINLDGVFLCNRAVVPLMLAGGYGRIVNVSSVAGKEGNPNASAYSASKAGVIGFTKSLGKELAGKGVIANALTPRNVRESDPRAASARADRVHARQDPHGTPWRRGRERGDGLLHGERGMQLHHRLDVRHVGRAHDLLGRRRCRCPSSMRTSTSGTSRASATRG